MMKVLFSLLSSTLLFALVFGGNDNPIVNSPAGLFRGAILKSQTGKDIFSFRGIRYAEAPIGPNRFKQATLTKSHDGLFDATENGPVCPQPDVESRVISEDCLRLNIYTTVLPHNSSLHEPNRPVIVFINPGALATSSGSSDELGPQLVLEQDAVFVTINYRLGALGFFSTGDSRAPGNAGMKDQVLALRWIQQNIAAFGGDSNKVTLAGYCVGSMSVLLHIASPMSRGLFHRALSMSSFANKEPLPINQKDLSIKQAKHLGCPTDSLDEMFNCLYGKSTAEFINSYEKRAKFHGHRVNWSPVVEQTQYHDSNEELFLTEQPVDIIREGKANFVPFFTGANVDEFGYAAMRPEEEAQHGDNLSYNEWNDKWEEVAPKRFDYEHGTVRSYNISKELRSFYLNDELLKAGSFQGLAKLYADSLTFFQVHRYERLMATYSSEPVWYYQYKYESCDTFKRWSNGTRFGIVHFDELLLLFKVGGRPDHCERDLQHAEEIWKLIANFADTGNPMPDDKGDEYPVKWQPSTKDQPQYLEYNGEKNKMVQGIIHQERMNKWDELFELA